MPLVGGVTVPHSHLQLLFRPEENAVFFPTMRDFGGNIDRFQFIWLYLPNNVHICAVSRSAGAINDLDLVHIVLNHLRPETERTTDYFWSVARRTRLEDANISRLMYEMNRTAFDEDSLVLKRQQEMLDAEHSGTPPRIPQDRIDATPPMSRCIRWNPSFRK